MELTKKYNELDLTVAISGQVDTSTAPELEKSVGEELEKAKKITLDFTEVDYISSAGLRVLLSLHKKQSERKEIFEIVNVSEEVMTILEMTGFTAFLNIK